MSRCGVLRTWLVSCKVLGPLNKGAGAAVGRSNPLLARIRRRSTDKVGAWSRSQLVANSHHILGHNFLCKYVYISVLRAPCLVVLPGLCPCPGLAAASCSTPLSKQDESDKISDRMSMLRSLGQ